MQKKIPIKIYPFLALVSLILVSSYSSASQKEKTERLLALQVETQKQVLTTKDPGRIQTRKYGKNIVLGSLWTLAFTGATVVSTYYASSSEDFDYLYKVAYISGTLAAGGAATTAYNIRNCCRSNRCITFSNQH